MRRWIALMLLIAGSASALEFTVNTLVDSVDVVTGDGQCSNAGGQCSLRAAVMEANALFGPDVIYLPRNTTHVLTLRDANNDTEAVNDLDIFESLTLSIQDPLLPAASVAELPLITGDASNPLKDRVFEVAEGQDILFYGIGIAYGDAQSSHSHERRGGGIYVGEEVTNFTLANSYVMLNRAGFGGGIYSLAASTTVSLSDISYNVWVPPLVIILGGGGGAIYTLNGALRLQYSSVHHNVSSQDDGFFPSAVDINLSSQSSFILSSTISANGSDLITQSAKMRGVSVASADLYIISSTISDNFAAGVSQAGNPGESFLFVRNTVLDANGDGVNLFNCVLKPNADFGDGAGNGFNLSSDGSCLLPAASGNRENIDPLLSPLQGLIDVNDAVFLAQHPLGGSPLIDAGSLLAPNSGNPNACHQFDQRFVERPRHGGWENRCDIGAYELDDVIFRNGFALIARSAQ